MPPSEGDAIDVPIALKESVSQPESEAEKAESTIAPADTDANGPAPANVPVVIPAPAQPPAPAPAQPPAPTQAPPVQPPPRAQQQATKRGSHKALVFKGNNFKPIYDALEARGVWDIVVTSEKENLLPPAADVDFIWKPTCNGLEMTKRPSDGHMLMLNHLAAYKEICHKDLLFKNFRRYCEAEKRNCFNMLPVTYIVHRNSSTDDESDAFLRHFRVLEDQRNRRDRRNCQEKNEKDAAVRAGNSSTPSLEDAAAVASAVQPVNAKAVLSASTPAGGRPTSNTGAAKRLHARTDPLDLKCRTAYAAPMRQTKSMEHLPHVPQPPAAAAAPPKSRGRTGDSPARIASARGTSQPRARPDAQSSKENCAVLPLPSASTASSRASTPLKTPRVPSPSKAPSAAGECVRPLRPIDFASGKRREFETWLPDRGKTCVRRVLERDSEHNMWLLKPAFMNRGRNITIFSQLQDVLHMLTDPARKWVVQKYIERPLLLHERKFDIRVWVLVTERIETYMFHTGYLRTSGSKYDLKNNAAAVHLTNNAVQMNAQNYSVHEDGNQLSFDDWQKYLDVTYPNDQVSVKDEMVPAMHQLIRESILSVKPLMQRAKREHTFEIFGYDFMVDASYHLWLIEVNTNPCLSLSSQLLEKLIPEMVSDAFRIVLDPLFPPTQSFVDAQPPNRWVRILPVE